jgi:DNA-binding transcriptional regulator YhcF (GntR family)
MSRRPLRRKASKIEAVRFWSTKNSEVPVREQLMRQVILGILSQDLIAGQKLPSTRALARRYKIHKNTASTAFHSLCAQGWLELRRGSGLYVRGIPQTAGRSDLILWLRHMLAEARTRGYNPEEVLRGMRDIVEPKWFSQVVIVEADEAMGEILREELQGRLRTLVKVADPGTAREHRLGKSLFVALPTRLAGVRASLPDGATVVTLRLRSISGLLEAEKMPPAHAMVAVASRSAEFRNTAMAVLSAVGIPSVCLFEIDAGLAGWQERVGASTIAIVDAVAGRQLETQLETEANKRVFRIVSDECLAELRAACDTQETVPSQNANGVAEP